MIAIIFVKRTTAPEYLRSSPYYLNAFQDTSDTDDCPIEVPAECCKQTTEVTNEDDLHLLLRTVRFWLIPEFIESSADFFSFIINDVQSLERALPIFELDLPYLGKLHKALHPPEGRSVVDHCGAFGLLSFIKYLRDSGHSWHSGASVEFATLAAARGHLDCLQYALEQGWEMSFEATLSAACNGRLDCLQFLHEYGGEHCRLGGLHGVVTAQAGSIPCVQFLKSIGVLDHSPTSDLLAVAAESGHLEMLRYLHSLGYAGFTSTFTACARYGHINCVQFLHEIYCPWDADTALVAAHSGHLEVLEFLHDNGCPWDERLLQPLSAQMQTLQATHNMLNVDAEKKRACFEYAVSCSCPITAGTFVLAVSLGGSTDIVLSMLARIHRGPCEVSAYIAAVEHNRLDMLKVLQLNSGTVWDETVTAAAMNGINIEILAYLLDHGCPYPANACVDAASSGRLDSLTCLHQHGVHIDGAVVIAAVKKGHLDCAMYAINNGCAHSGPAACATATAVSWTLLRDLHQRGAQWDVSTCLAAIRNDSFECLKYAVKNGCPIDATLPAEAALQGNLVMLKWLHRNRHCPWDAGTTAAAVLSDSVECLSYAVSNGCPYQVSAEALAQAPLCQEYMATEGFAVLTSNGSIAGTKRKADEMTEHVM